MKGERDMRSKDKKKQDAKDFAELFMKLPEEKRMYVVGIIHGLQANVPQAAAQQVSSS